MDRIYLWFEFDGQRWDVNTSKIESKEQFKDIAMDLIESGNYITEIRKKYNLDYDQVVSNLFRDREPLLFLVKLITEEQAIPHENFWDYEIGRNVADNSYFRKWNLNRKHPYKTDFMAVVQSYSEPEKKPSKESSKSRHRKTLFNLWDGICVSCADEVETRFMVIDHIIPKSKNGSNHISNLQLLCWDCNNRKGNKDNNVFMDEMQETRRKNKIKRIKKSGNENKLDSLLDKLVKSV